MERHTAKHGAWRYYQRGQGIGLKYRKCEFDSHYLHKSEHSTGVVRNVANVKVVSSNLTVRSKLLIISEIGVKDCTLRFHREGVGLSPTFRTNNTDTLLVPYRVIKR